MADQANYEMVFILHPSTPEDGVPELVAKVKQFITASGGQVTQADIWGRRRFAYPIRKLTDGYYALVKMSMATPAVAELERNLKLTEPVIRYLIVRE